MSQDISFEGKTALLVEDELFLVEKISGQLDSLGIEKVLSATDLETAKQHVAAEQIDIALLDVNLPNGETTAELGISLASKHVATVFFSGYDISDSAEVARSHEFLEKPLSVSRLKASMQRAMVRVSASVGQGAEKMAGQEARQSG